MTNIPQTLHCPSCDTSFPPGSACCAFCGMRPRSQPNSLWRSPLWLVGAYRIWSLLIFGYALVVLAMSDHPASYLILFYVLFPFGAALALSYRFGHANSRWVVAFLLLVDLGVIIAPEHRLLPFLNMFPGLPKTQNRILTWYFLVYGLLQFVVLPPVAFFRSLRTAWRGGMPTLSPWICLLGFAVWGLILTILAIGLTQ